MLSYVLATTYSFAQHSTDSTTYYYYKIISPNSSDDLTAGYVYFKNYAAEKRKNKDTVGLVYALRLLAQTEFDLGQIYTSEKSATEAKILVESASPTLQFPADTHIGINNLLGMVYRTTAQAPTAIRIYSEALKKTTSLQDSLILLNNLANAYRDTENYEEAIAILTSVLKTHEQLTDTIETARALDNLGYTQAMAGNPDGLPNMLEALSLRKELDEPSQLFTSYNHLSEYYKNIGDLETARTYAVLGKNAADKVSVGYRKEALATYLGLSKNEDIVAYIKITDSIRKASLQQDIKFASIEYDFSKERERTQHALLDREKERQRKTIFQIIGLSILLLGIALFFVLKYRHRKEKVEEVYRTESRISKKVHDEVANDLYQIMTKIQTSALATDNLLDELDSVYHKTRDISKELSLVDMKGAFGELLNDLLLSYQSEQVNVITKNLAGVDWSVVSKTKKIALFRVLQELMTNMRKHSDATVVVVSSTQVGDKFQIEYVDNGKGGPFTKGNGLRNAENRIHSVNGTIIFDTNQNQGVKVKISV